MFSCMRGENQSFLVLPSVAYLGPLRVDYGMKTCDLFDRSFRLQRTVAALAVLKSS